MTRVTQNDKSDTKYIQLMQEQVCTGVHLSCGCVCVCVQCSACHLGSIPLLWVSGGRVEGAEDLHGLVVGRLGCKDSLEALGRLGRGEGGHGVRVW